MIKEAIVAITTICFITATTGSISMALAPSMIAEQ